MMETLVEQARTLSSGTIASLIGRKEYDLIDEVRERFARHCERMVRLGFFDEHEKWQNAWRSYVTSLRIVYAQEQAEKRG